MIVSCAEALIDFLPAPGGAYLPAPGGSPFNVAIGVARLGAPAGFLGRLSTDFFGDMLADALSRDGVDLGFVTRVDKPSTLAFVKLKPGEEPQYAFFNTDAADRTMTPADLPADLGGMVQAIHVSSFSLVIEPVASALAALVTRERGRRLISLDPNVRPAMVGPRDAYRARLEKLVAGADLVKVSRADLEWLYPDADPEARAAHWATLGPAAVVMTAGGDGAIAWRGAAAPARVASTPVQVVDTVGAGDSFSAALLAELWRTGCLSRDGIGRADLGAALAFANRVAGITCGRAGANPPRRDELG